MRMTGGNGDVDGFSNAAVGEAVEAFYSPFHRPVNDAIGMNQNSGYKLGSPPTRSNQPQAQTEAERFGISLLPATQESTPSPLTTHLRMMHASPKVGMNIGEPPRPLSRKSSNSQLEFGSAMTGEDMLDQVRAFDSKELVKSKAPPHSQQPQHEEEKRASVNQRCYGYHQMFENEDGDGGVDQ